MKLLAILVIGILVGVMGNQALDAVDEGYTNNYQEVARQGDAAQILIFACLFNTQLIGRGVDALEADLIENNLLAFKKDDDLVLQHLQNFAGSVTIEVEQQMIVGTDPECPTQGA